jgi:N-acetylglucosamine repressor
MGLLLIENAYLEELNNIERKKYVQKIKIIKYLYVEGAQSIANIGNRLNISLPTLTGVITELIAEGLVEKQGRGKSGGGRKPDLYGLQENSLFVLGVEMGNHETRMAIFNNEDVNVTGTQTFSIRLSKDGQAIDALCQHARELIQQSGINPDKLIGIGINMPGLVDSRAGINHTYLQVPGQSLRQVLEEKLNKPVYIENDAKSIALAEYRFGLAEGKKDVLVISIDWGLGLGMLLNGKLYSGTSGFAGEFSHIPLIENGELCHCGKQGCLETVASGRALARLAKEGIRAGKSAMLNAIVEQDADTVEPHLVIEAAMKGDQYAIHILSQVGFHLGKGIAVLIQLLNPEMIILGGRVAQANHYIITPIQQALHIYCMPQLREKTSIAVSRLGENAGLLGSVAMVMENIFEDHIE